MSLPAWAARCGRRLGVFTVLALAGPWAVGELVKTGLQPGLHDDAWRQQLLVDYIVIGAIVFGLTMVLTYAIGCWIRAVMNGPERRADPFPHDSGRAPADD